MAEAKVVKKRRARAHKYQSLLNLFTLRVPSREKGRDGRMYDVFIRTGPMGGAYTKRELMQKEGMLAELSEVEKDAQKRYKSLAEVKEVVLSREAKLRRLLDSRLNSMKMAVAREAEKQGLIPLAASVRIHNEDEERKFFFQGFANKDGDLIIGGRDDAALWAIEMMSNTEAMARKHRLSRKVGENLKKGLLSGPVRGRLESALGS